LKGDGLAVRARTRQRAQRPRFGSRWGRLGARNRVRATNIRHFKSSG
jgi:hypothetical protein